MPAVTPAANHRCRCYDGRRYHGRCYYDRGCDDWPVRATMSIRTTVKSGTTSALRTGAVDADE
jgi:hypothetical protein